MFLKFTLTLTSIVHLKACAHTSDVQKQSILLRRLI